MISSPLRFAPRLTQLLLAMALLYAAIVGHGRGPGQGRQAWTPAAWPAWVGPAENFSPPPDFFDLKVVLWGLEIHRTGRDVYAEPPAIDAPFVYNYPSAWLALAPLGWRIVDVVPLAAVMIGLFLISFVRILNVTRWRDVVWFAGILLSPPLLIAVGHANIDMAIFVLVVLAAWWHVNAQRFPAGAYGLLATAAVLKLYPAAALPALLDGRRRTLVVIGGVILAIALWFSFNAAELRTISDHTPRPSNTAFGCQVLASYFLEGATRQPDLAQRIEVLGGLAACRRILALVSVTGYGLLLLTAGISILRYRVKSIAPPSAPTTTLAQTLFRCGALIYLGAFAIGHNWAHREIFLLLLIPACVPAPASSVLGRFRSILPWYLLGLFWLTTLPLLGAFALGQLACWILAGWLARQLVRDYASLFGWSEARP